MAKPNSLNEIIKHLDAHISTSTYLECELEECAGGVVLRGNRRALLHTANRLIKLANTGISGSHFTIDQADIAPNSKIELTIARKDFQT